MSTITVLDALTRPNPPIRKARSNTTTLTYDPIWDNIEDLKLWSDFTFEKLSDKFRKELKSKIPRLDWRNYIASAELNITPSEKWLNVPLAGHYADINHSLGVVSAPFQLKVGDGDEFYKGAGGPDLGMIKQGVPYVVGDLKLGWLASTAVKGWKNDYYQGRSAQNLLTPVQQVQHYMRLLNLRYGFIISETDVIVLFGELAQEADRSSPRPQRRTNRQSYASMGSDVSGLTSSIGELSLQEIARLKYRTIPWTNHGSDSMTCSLALFFISLLALEEHRLAVDRQSQKPSQEALKAQTTQPPSQATAQVRLPFEKGNRVARPVLMEFLLPQLLKDAEVVKKEESAYVVRIPITSQAALGQIYETILDLSERNIDAFVPRTNIDRSIIEKNIGSHVKNAYFLHEHTRGGKEGYMISMPKTEDKIMKEALEALMRESRSKRQKR